MAMKPISSGTLLAGAAMLAAGLDVQIFNDVMPGLPKLRRGMRPCAGGCGKLTRHGRCKACQVDPNSGEPAMGGE